LGEFCVHMRESTCHKHHYIHRLRASVLLSPQHTYVDSWLLLLRLLPHLLLLWHTEILDSQPLSTVKLLSTAQHNTTTIRTVFFFAFFNFSILLVVRGGKQFFFVSLLAFYFISYLNSYLYTKSTS
jgi:hypothetical protein